MARADARGGGQQLPPGAVRRPAGAGRRPAPTASAVLPAARRHARAVPGRPRGGRRRRLRGGGRPRARDRRRCRTTRRRSRCTAASCSPRTATRPWAAGRRRGAGRGAPGPAARALRPAGRGRRHRGGDRGARAGRGGRPAARGGPPRADAAVRRRRVAASRHSRSTTSCARRSGATWRPSPTRRPRDLYRALLRGEADVDPLAGDLRRQAPRAPARATGRACPPQPADRADELHRARPRAARGRPPARPQSPAHAHGRRRVGQDTPRPRGRDGTTGRLSRRRLARRARRPRRSRVGAGGDRLCARPHPSVPAPGPRGPQRAARRMAGAADPRQLRAPGHGVRRPRRAPAGLLPGAAHPGHEPGAPARPGRGDLAGPVARAPGPGAAGGARGARLLRVDPPVLRAREPTSRRASRSARTTPARWPRSARGWTACRSRWSSPPRAWGRSRRRRSPSGSATRSPS